MHTQYPSLVTHTERFPSMRIIRLALTLSLLLTFPPWGWSQIAPPIYTFQTLDLVGPNARLLMPRGLTDDAWLATTEPCAGCYSYRVDPALVATPVICNPADFPRSPTAATAGPDIMGMDNLKAVAGGDQHADGRQYGIVQPEGGSCSAYLHPSSEGTVYTGQSTVPGTLLGIFWNADVFPGETGLLRFHAFSQTAAGVTTLLTGRAPNDRLFPTAGNSQGVLVGCGYYAIGADNSYVQQGWLRRADGTIEDLDTPDGNDFGPTAINEDGIVIGTEGGCEVGGGAAWWYDSTAHAWYPLAQFPTPATVAIDPESLNTHGELTGTYIEAVQVDVPFPDVQHRTHTFVATPTPPLVTLPPDPEPDPEPCHKRRHCHKHRHQLSSLRAHQAAQDSATATHKWRPALEEGRVVLWGDGDRVLGRRPRK